MSAIWGHKRKSSTPVVGATSTARSVTTSVPGDASRCSPMLRSICQTLMERVVVLRVLVIFVCLVSLPTFVEGFGCFSDYSMSWCNNQTEESCVHDYTFSVSHFQRKLDGYYRHNRRPPILEAYFLLKTPKPYQDEFLTADCAPPLIMAYLLVAESRIQFDPQALGIFDMAMQHIQSMSPEQTFMLTQTDTWPFSEAVQRIEASAEYYDTLRARRGYPGGAMLDGGPQAQAQPAPAGAVSASSLANGVQFTPITMDFVMSHCKERDFQWMDKDMRNHLSYGVQGRLLIYEKCHEQIATDDPFFAQSIVASRMFTRGVISVPTPDPSFVARGDECSAYLRHIVDRYGTEIPNAGMLTGGGNGGGQGVGNAKGAVVNSDLADFTIFMHSDPYDHMHMSFMGVILQAVARGTFEQHFMHLNGPRHVRTLTPCLQAVSEAIFGHPITYSVGPYCCAQFLVSRDRIQSRPLAFYERMRALVNGSMPYDLCTTSRVARSTHCYGMEFLWHIVFGEEADPPLRQDDPTLPVAFRLKFGVEHDKRDWNDVVLSPNVPKKIVTQQDWDGENFVYTRGGPGTEKRGDDAPRPA
ncbi:unnamed protein product [Amoebophrya sp. A25]|nr:unnamed protein product [Amoebophrya sp. A25]|eukprot:GSA25T00009084001.1